MIVDISKKILIVGLGLLGGSYAKVLKRFGFHISAITKDQSSIDYALSDGMIDEGSIELDEKLIGEADLVIFALYPHIFVEWIKKNQGLLKSGAIITDVTGVKGSIVYKIQNMLRSDVEFIAAHPMAGRELSGVEYSDPTVFEGANYIVTPTEKNSAKAIEICKELGYTLGFSKISELTIEEHDRMIAFLSQLTHCIAVSLMNCNETPDLEKYTGDSFRDLTRIAKINDKMWSELFLMNKEALISEMDSFIKEFTAFRNLIESDNTEKLREKMRASTTRRALFDKPKSK
jgi:prephenate dehydrogenase